LKRASPSNSSKSKFTDNDRLKTKNIYSLIGEKSARGNDLRNNKSNVDITDESEIVSIVKY
jgi:hypothetical protein